MDVSESLDARHDIGGNNPPSAIADASRLTATATGWLNACSEITDAVQAKEVGDLVDKLRASKKALAAAQKAELAPHDQAIADVKASYRGPAGELEEALTALLARSSAWLVKERDRIAAEKAAKEAEARRLREEAARLERERIEAARKVEEERRRVVDAEKASADDLERVEAERQTAIEAEARAAEAAKTAKFAERAAEKKPEVAAIKTEPAKRAVTLRVYWSAAITNDDDALASYQDHPTVRKAALAAVLQVANEAARTSKDVNAAPPGIRFIKDERAT